MSQRRYELRNNRAQNAPNAQVNAPATPIRSAQLSSNSNRSNSPSVAAANTSGVSETRQTGGLHKEEGLDNSAEGASYADVVRQSPHDISHHSPNQSVHDPQDSIEIVNPTYTSTPYPKRRQPRSSTPSAVGDENQFQSFVEPKAEERDLPPHLSNRAPHHNAPAGPSKGKDVDPENYGMGGIHPDNLDPQKQREMFASIELANRIAKEAVGGPTDAASIPIRTPIRVPTPAPAPVPPTSPKSSPHPRCAHHPRVTIEEVNEDDQLEDRIDEIEKSIPEKRRTQPKDRRERISPSNLAEYAKTFAKNKEKSQSRDLQPSSQLPDNSPLGIAMREAASKRKARRDEPKRGYPLPDGNDGDDEGDDDDDSGGGGGGGGGHGPGPPDDPDLDDDDDQRRRGTRMRIKPVPPHEYDGSPDDEKFLSFMEEGTGYLDDGNVPLSSRMRVLSRFMTGKARTFYQNHVRTTRPEDWDLPTFYRKLFDYCFPTSYREDLQDRMDSCYQRDRPVKVFAAELEKFAVMLDFRDETQLVRRLWKGLKEDIQERLYLMMLAPGSSTFDEVVEGAETIERALNIRKSGNRSRNSPHANSVTPTSNFQRRRDRPRFSSDRFDNRKSGNFQKPRSDNGGGKSFKNNRSRGGWRLNGLNNATASSSRQDRDRPRTFNGEKKHQFPKLSDKEKQRRVAEARCFKCGETGHFSRNCPRGFQMKSENGRGPPGIPAGSVLIDESEDLRYLAETTETMDMLSIGMVLVDEDDAEDGSESESSEHEPDDVPDWLNTEEWGTGSSVLGDYLDRNVECFSDLFQIGNFISRRARNILETQAYVENTAKFDVFPDQGDDVRFIATQIDDETYVVEDYELQVEQCINASVLEDPEFDLIEWWEMVLDTEFYVNRHEKMGPAYAEGVAYHLNRFIELVHEYFAHPELEEFVSNGRPNIQTRNVEIDGSTHIEIVVLKPFKMAWLPLEFAKNPAFDLVAWFTQETGLFVERLRAIKYFGWWHHPAEADGELDPSYLDTDDDEDELEIKPEDDWHSPANDPCERNICERIQYDPDYGVELDEPGSSWRAEEQEDPEVQEGANNEAYYTTDSEMPEMQQVSGDDQTEDEETSDEEGVPGDVPSGVPMAFGAQVPRNSYSAAERNAALTKDFRRVLPKPLVVVVQINGHPAKALLDSGCLVDMVSTTLVDQLKMQKIVLEKPLPLQLAVKGSRSKINCGVKAKLAYQNISEDRYFDVANLMNYDLILGTPFLFQHQIRLGLNPASVVVGSETALPIKGSEVAFLAVSSKAADVYNENLQRVRDMLRAYAEPVCKDPVETPLPPLREINHHIPIIDKTKRYPWRPSKCPEPLKDAWNKKKDVYLKNGRWEITTASNTVPLLCLQKVRKPGETELRLRTVVDLRSRNANTEKMASPLPDIESILRRVARHKYRTLVDGKDMFECIRIVPEDVPYSAMTTPDGNMVSHVIQQGDVNGPATCQALMSHLMGSRIGKFVDVYIDDIVIYTGTLEEHIRRVKEVIDILRKAQIYLNRNKLEILPAELHILGHVIDDNGIRMDPDKVDSIVKWKTPTNRELARGFLGSVGYLADNIPGVRIPMGVLHAITGDTVPFKWGPTEQRAFDAIKEQAQMCRDHARKPLDYGKHAPAINMVTDGCATGIAGVVSQGDDWKKGRVAAFYSAKLNSAQQNYPVHEIEMLAGVETMLRHRDILQGTHFKWYTDHKGLIHLLQQKNLSGRQARWLEKISEFDFEVVYVPGVENILSDALSRLYSNDKPGTVRAALEYTQFDEEFDSKLLEAQGVTVPVFVGLEAMALTAKQRAQRKRRAREVAEKAALEAEKQAMDGETSGDADRAVSANPEQRQEGGSIQDESMELTNDPEPSNSLDDALIIRPDDPPMPAVLPEEYTRREEEEESSEEDDALQFAERERKAAEAADRPIPRAPPSSPVPFEEFVEKNDPPDELFNENDETQVDIRPYKPSGDSDKENVPPGLDGDPKLDAKSKRRAHEHTLRRFEDLNLLKNSISSNKKLTHNIEDLVRGKYTLDPFFRKIIDSPRDFRYFQIKNELIHYVPEDRIALCIPDIMVGDRRVRELVVSEAHSLLAHLGPQKVYDYLWHYVWWNNMMSEIQKYCDGCFTCKRSKPSTKKPYGLLNPLKVPSQPWESIGIDFVGPMPASKDRNGTYDSIAVIIDLLTAMVHIVPSKTTYTARDIAELVFAEVYKHHGIPRCIVSDRDVLFTSHFWTHLSKFIGVQTNMSSAYHPQTDGATERANRTIVQMLRSCISPDQTDWVQRLPGIEFAINMSRSASTGYAPFFLNSGRLPRAMIWGQNPASNEYPGVREYAERVRQSIMIAHDNIIAARVKQTIAANRKREPAPFEEGDMVYVSTKNLTIPQGLARKLIPKFLGPYRITRDFGNNSYRVDLPPRLKQRGVHSSFHAEYLKIHDPDDDRLFPGRSADQIAELGGEDNEWAIDKIVSHSGSGSQSLFEIRWKTGDHSWLNYSRIKDLYAFEEYLEAMGVDKIGDLPRGKGQPPDDAQAYLGAILGVIDSE